MISVKGQKTHGGFIIFKKSPVSGVTRGFREEIMTKQQKTSCLLDCRATGPAIQEMKRPLSCDGKNERLRMDV